MATRLGNRTGIAVLCGLLAIALASFIWLRLPHERHVSSVGVLLFKLLPFGFALIAVSLLDHGLARRIRLPLWGPPVCFLAFFCYFVPKVLGFANIGDFENAYYHMLAAVPFIILTIAFVYRLGGADSGPVLRLGTALLLVMLSGIEDLAFVLLHDIRPIPAVWTWASHMTVVLGHPPTRVEAYTFIVVHILIAAGVLTLPLGWALEPVRRRSVRRRRA